MTTTEKSTQSQHHAKKKHKILFFFMIVCALGFFISLGLFIIKISDVREKWSIHPHNPLGIIFSGSRVPYSESGTLNIDSIETWMTFAYINFRFHLPPAYLKEKLSLEDKRYPEVPIGRYIKKNNLDPNIFLKQLKEAIREDSLKTLSPQ